MHIRNNYPPNAYRAGCAITRAPLRADETFVIALDIGAVAEPRGDGTYIANREVCISQAAAREIGALVGMVEGHTHDELRNAHFEALAELARTRDELARTTEDLEAVRRIFHTETAEQPAEPVAEEPTTKAPARRTRRSNK